MDLELRKAIADQLRKDYLHRVSKDSACAICGAIGTPLAFHVLEKSVAENIELPQGFVPLSQSGGYYRGSFPLCENCAPPCTKCRLPVLTNEAIKFGEVVNAKQANGICRNLTHSLSALDRALKKIGAQRFKSGLLRSWLVFSVFWISYFLIQDRLVEKIRYAYNYIFDKAYLIQDAEFICYSRVFSRPENLGKSVDVKHLVDLCIKVFVPEVPIWSELGWAIFFPAIGIPIITFTVLWVWAGFKK